jgi:hypothetical protein
MTRFALELDDYSLRKLTEAARAAEVSPGRMATMMLEAWLRDEVGPTPERAPPVVEEPARAWAGAADGGAGPLARPAEPAGLIIELVEPLGSRFADLARDGGVSQAVLAAEVLDSQLFDYDDFEWPEGGDPRQDKADYDLDEVGRPWSEVRPEFMALIDKAFGKPE